jgi:hypothetical protein
MAVVSELRRKYEREMEQVLAGKTSKEFKINIKHFQ